MLSHFQTTSIVDRSNKNFSAHPERRLCISRCERGDSIPIPRHPVTHSPCGRRTPAGWQTSVYVNDSAVQKVLRLQPNNNRKIGNWRGENYEICGACADNLVI